MWTLNNSIFKSSLHNLPIHVVQDANECCTCHTMIVLVLIKLLEISLKLLILTVVRTQIQLQHSHLQHSMVNRNVTVSSQLHQQYPVSTAQEQVQSTQPTTSKSIAISCKQLKTTNVVSDDIQKQSAETMDEDLP